MVIKNNLFNKFAKSNRRICLGRSHQAGLIQKLRKIPVEYTSYSKLNNILTECSWGDPGRLTLNDKNSGEIPAEYATVN
jgi:hypothetical protein